MKRIYFTMVFFHLIFSASAQISFVSENFYREIPSEEYSSIKHGFDFNFYTPLVNNLNGTIEKCVIEEYFPIEEIEKLMASEHSRLGYTLQKEKYDAQTKKYKKKNPFLYLEPFDYSGYDTHRFVYEMDSNQSKSLSLLSIKLLNFNNIKINNLLSLYQIRWKSKTPVVFYQAPSWKDRNLNSIIISYLDGNEKYNTSLQKLQTDSLLDYKLNVLSDQKEWFSDTNQSDFPEIIRIYNSDSSTMDDGYYLNEQGRIPLFSKKFNSKGLLCHQVFYTRFFYRDKKSNVDDIETIVYNYDDNGLPVKITYRKGDEQPINYFLKFTRPDSYGNFTRMEVLDEENRIISDIYWYITYGK